ncbi:hypothetical protein OA78_1457 [Latilactobacillus curvatus]|nr:hypothetical protein OA78_1457 [Latilactobacillus curvatus]
MMKFFMGIRNGLLVALPIWCLIIFSITYWLR